MTEWFAANWGTLLVSLILIGLVTLIIASLRNKKKKGISSCGCHCDHCAMGGSCHQK